MCRLGLCLHIVFVVEKRAQCSSCTGRTSQPTASTAPPLSVFVCLDWRCVVCFYVGAGCSCSVHNAASQEDWGKEKYAKKKKSVVISNKQQGHIKTCNGKPQRNASETKIFFREAAESLDLHSGQFDPNHCFAHPILV